jgi:hypothetical protein
MKQYLARIKDDLAQTEAASFRLPARYGDFTAFFYRPDFDLFLRQQVLPFQLSPTDYLAFLDHDHWGAKHPFNFPGRASQIPVVLGLTKRRQLLCWMRMVVNLSSNNQLPIMSCCV